MPGTHFWAQPTHSIGLLKGAVTQGKRVRNVCRHLLPSWESDASVRNQTGPSPSPSPMTRSDSLQCLDHFHVWQASRISVLMTGLSSALSSQLAILGLPAPLKHPEAFASHIKGLSPGGWQAARYPEPGLMVTGLVGVPGTQWWTRCMGSHIPRSRVTVQR